MRLSSQAKSRRPHRVPFDPPWHPRRASFDPSWHCCQQFLIHPGHCCHIYRSTIFAGVRHCSSMFILVNHLEKRHGKGKLLELAGYEIPIARRKGKVLESAGYEIPIAERKEMERKGNAKGKRLPSHYSWCLPSPRRLENVLWEARRGSCVQGISTMKVCQSSKPICCEKKKEKRKIRRNKTASEECLVSFLFRAHLSLQLDVSEKSPSLYAGRTCLDFDGTEGRSGMACCNVKLSHDSFSILSSQCRNNPRGA
ncbi:hypothetical protein QBC33DRAFT_12991 [Phialemonium atrogriseum]|uniref:Uncharacterized protein n=1 Tax=Phialemonium atrogriseum TaxID=1093897 RepID=A0AAJ0C9K9_9PEZI|nr:uncharacterized protein QBC33DRAFT_12991 [Phialemonium atrogriseum]KAK1772501.1 hypothetical protein QBC33DRAFT_12991 [Phialemonium atrogriseum]